MAKYIRPKQLENQNVFRHFAMKFSPAARVDKFSIRKVN